MPVCINSDKLIRNSPLISRPRSCIQISSVVGAKAARAIVKMTRQNAQDLDMDMNMLALALLTPQVCLEETPWTAAQPDAQPARSADASRKTRSPKAPQVRQRPSAQSKPRKTAQTNRRRSRSQVASSATIRITPRASDVPAEETAALNEATAMEASYGANDVFDALMKAFDETLTVAVSGTGTSDRTRFRLHVVRNLLVLYLQRTLSADALHNVMSVEQITGLVLDMLQRFGICIQ